MGIVKAINRAITPVKKTVNKAYNSALKKGKQGTAYPKNAFVNKVINRGVGVANQAMYRFSKARQRLTGDGTPKYLIKGSTAALKFVDRYTRAGYLGRPDRNVSGSRGKSNQGHKEHNPFHPGRPNQPWVPIVPKPIVFRGGKGNWLKRKLYFKRYKL